MRTRKIVERVHKSKEDTYTCDLCGKPATHSSSWSRDEVTISCREGDVYPEGDFTHTTLTDCCVACFNRAVVPALRALGLKFRTEDSDGDIDEKEDEST